MVLKKETVLITGASSGIGASIAQKFSREGYEVLLLGRDEKKLISVANKCKETETQASVSILAFDLKELKSHSAPLLQKLKTHSPVTTLVNNAGIFHRQSFYETSDEVWLEQFQVNLLSAVQITKLLWPRLTESKKGSIINIASTLAVKPSPLTSAYSAIKAALINWTLNLAQEGGPLQIRANCICPGIIDTPIHGFHALDEVEKAKAIKPLLDFQLLNTLGLPDDIAEAAYFLGSNLSRWTTGSVLHVDGGIHIK